MLKLSLVKTHMSDATFIDFLAISIDPLWLAKELLKRLDDKLDVTQAVVESIPSIVSMNQSQGEGTGDPALQGSPSGGVNNASIPNTLNGSSLPPIGNIN